MSSSGRCKTCGKFMMYPKSHKCPPAWRAWCEDHGETEEDAGTVYAYDAQEAAEEYASDYDISCGDYPLLDSGGSDCICVERDGVVKRFTIEATTVPQYSAWEKTDA